jgi:hypothetical protein
MLLTHYVVLPESFAAVLDRGEPPYYDDCLRQSCLPTDSGSARNSGGTVCPKRKKAEIPFEMYFLF